MKCGRNDPCPCGSGKKYKKCCLHINEVGWSKLPPDEAAEVRAEMEKQRRPKPEKHIPIVPSVEFAGKRIRAVRNRIYTRHPGETVMEFLIDPVLKYSLGAKWGEAQKNAPPEQQHVIMHWIRDYFEWRKMNAKKENEVREGIWGAVPSGSVKALGTLAYDLLCLQQADSLPSFLREKLRRFESFQSARYEIAVAAMMARAGLTLEFLDKKEHKTATHCEFIATHKETKIRVGVEAKSRRREGVLHQPGRDAGISFNKDIATLYRKARAQKPDGLPFLIFIDVNSYPMYKAPPEWWPWLRDAGDVVTAYGAEPRPENALILTNFPYHFGDNKDPCPSEERVMDVANNPITPLTDDRVLKEVWESVQRYGFIPNEM